MKPYVYFDLVYFRLGISMSIDSSTTDQGYSNKMDTSADTGKLCILGHLGLVFSWSCFVSCLLFLLFMYAYVMCAPVPGERSTKMLP